MEKAFWRRAAWEVFKAALSATAFCLFATALVAVFVRAYAPPQVVLTAVNWTLKCVASFCFCMIFIKKERALFKGLAAGCLTVFLTMFLFAAIGGGFHLDLLFLAEIVLCTALGGAGGLIGAKLRKS